MKVKLSLIGLISISLFGCAVGEQRYSGTKSSPSLNSSCGYENMPSSEFVYTGNEKYFSLYFESDRGYLGKSNLGKDLVGKKFKFSGNINQSSGAINKYPKIINIEGVDYEFDSNVKTAVMFEGCTSALWFKGHTNYQTIQGKEKFNKVDGTSFTVEDLAYAYGTTNVKPAVYEAIIETDEFADTATIRTKFQDRVLLRAWSNKKLTKKPKDFQLYADLLFLNDWGNVKTARTKDGKAYTLTNINKDADCSRITGCALTETVGVVLPISLLENNKDGFQVKFYGTKQQVVNVSGFHVKSLIKGLSEVK